MSASISFALTQKISINDSGNDFFQLCEQIAVQACIRESTYSHS